MFIHLLEDQCGTIVISQSVSILCVYIEKSVEGRRECSAEGIYCGNVWAIKLGKHGHRPHDFSSYMTCTVTT